MGWLLATSLCLLAISLAWRWLCVGTYRLYLDERRAPEISAPVLARQRFDVAGGRVAPQIVSTGDDRLSFPVDLPRPSELQLRVVPSREATFEIAIVERGARRILCRRALSGAADIVQPLPATSGVLELANEGELLWSDPRLVEEADVAPAVLGILALLALTGFGLRAGRLAPLAFPRASWARTALLGGLTAGVTAALCLVLLEVGLRAIGDRLPNWITDPRRNLGEVNTDPRWQDSASYGPRLAARVSTFCEWQQGDIVRMGFLPPGLVRHAAYRFPFVTDADGFRNSEPESSATEVAALGDSFTDGMTLPAELTWPARVARLLGVSVRNYGTAGFGPGQELLVLKEYARARHARRVVVGFFAGNDLVDAERFENFQRDGAFPSLGRGWKFKPVIARFDQLYLTSLYQGASGLLGDRGRDPLDRQSSPSAEDYDGEDPTVASATRPAFDRGVFTVPVAGRVLRFAFLPPYLNRLTLSRQQLEASRGWDLTRRSYREMHRLVRAQGGELVVLFIPFKAQVYLPLLEASFPGAELQSVLRLALGGQPPPGLEFVTRNRLALNDLMREFCAEEGITFLDLTADLQATLSAGHNVYFPDDSHWNAAGHEVAATALGRLLRAQPVIQRASYKK